MNIQDLREAQVRYETLISDVLKDRQSLYQIRSAFVRYFNNNRLRTMALNEYVIGAELPKRGFNFCYTLERKLNGLGRILGATAFKFGIYYGRTKSDAHYEYRFRTKFGNSSEEAFEEVRKSIQQLLISGADENFDMIAKNKLSPMFKGKILCTYFPDRFLNVFASDHLNYFLTQFDLDTPELIQSDVIYKREALINFKNEDEIMKNWSVDLFSHFLYTEYPGRPPRKNSTNENNSDPLSEYRTPDFPANPTASFIELNILPPKDPQQLTNRRNNKQRGKTDYEKAARKLRKLGDRGEKIVLDLERQRLIKEGRSDLAEKVVRISLKSDDFGYDILSFEKDNEERHIEVKATQANIGSANFFLTENELNTAKNSKNYFIYMVYLVTSEFPKVWIIKNPFNPENETTLKKPINYRITINATKNVE